MSKIKLYHSLGKRAIRRAKVYIDMVKRSPPKLSRWQLEERRDYLNIEVGRALGEAGVFLSLINEELD